MISSLQLLICYIPSLFEPHAMHEGAQFFILLLVLFVELRVGVCQFGDEKGL